MTLKPSGSPELRALIEIDAKLIRPKPIPLSEVGKCPCGASYYHVEDIGKDCEIQYCRGTVRATNSGDEKHGS